MKRVDRRWKAYPAGNKGESSELNVQQQGTSDCLKNKCSTVNMDKPKNCMPRGSNAMKSNQLLCGRGVPCEDVGLEKGNFLKPCLANYDYKFYT